jgi:HAD superfamily hydrolase (TIGR01509 family)
MTVVILDIDGTLVDSNYHHAIAWHRALRRFDVVVPLWRIHRHMGMGGDQVVQALTNQDTENDLGDDIRDAEKDLYRELIDEVQPIAGARAFVEELRGRAHTIVLASSAKHDEVDHYIDLLDLRPLIDAHTTAADVEKTKPHPDLVHVALKKVAGEPSDAVMVGDTTWDIAAASKVGLPTFAVLTGGYGREELAEAGAIAVYESVAEMKEKLDGTQLG